MFFTARSHRPPTGLDTMKGMSTDRAQALGRTAWLLLGAAIGIAAVLLALSFAAVIAPALPVPVPVVVVICLLLVGLIGLIPGVRELEVEAARSMLGVREDLVVPARPGWHDRGRTIGWVSFHLTGGLLAGALLFGIVPGAVVTAVSGMTGSQFVVTGITMAGPPVLRVLLSALAIVIIVGLVALLGRLARLCAPRLLGPTPSDRLAVAEARLAAESEYARLARDLHDGIGHALTIIAVQATATRRAQRAGPVVDETLTVIETTARDALAELDNLLGMLRDEPAARTLEPDLEHIDRLLERYRDAGMPLTATLADPTGLPALASRTAYRIVAEGLANAARHGGPGPVHVTMARTGGRLSLEVSNPLGSQPAARPGRGLDGIRERVRLFGGSSAAGPNNAGRWCLHAAFPTGETR